jgi:hypothetical protein
MHDLFKWVDRIAAVITVATFAFSALHFLGFIPAPHFDLSNGRRLFVAVVVYELVMAIAVSGASALIYRSVKMVFAAMIAPVVIWAFVNVDVMRTLFGQNVWSPVKHGWWIFKVEQGQNTTGFWLSLMGAALFLALYAVLFVRRAAYDQFHQGDETTRRLAQTNAMVVVLSAVIIAFVAHVGWIWLGGAKVS